MSAVNFIWNSRPCTGGPIHKAVAIDLGHDSEAADEVKQILDKDPSQISARFHYETAFRGEAQEGSGEAIHIAASRGSRALVELLLNRGARMDAMVTRASKNHYDVLHAAVFGEGRGGVPEVIDLLIKKCAKMTKNADGRSPLHLAFQTGKMLLIKNVRQHMQLLDPQFLDQVEAWSKGAHNDVAMVPLELGIQRGNLTENELAQVAPETSTSLRIFMAHEPFCIPKFFDLVDEEDPGASARLAQEVAEGANREELDRDQRANQAGQAYRSLVSADQGAEQLVQDLSAVLRQCPQAAMRLINALSSTPECENDGWHPLPKRMSFAANTWSLKLRHLLNPPRMMKPIYARDITWRYDAKEFKAPDWHQELELDRQHHGRSIRDVEIKVCHVKNLICAEFMSALKAAAEADDSDQEALFTDKIIKGVLHTVWWRGAVKVDLVQIFLSVWALTLLVFDSVLIADFRPDEVPARMLRHSGGDGNAVDFGGDSSHDAEMWLQLSHRSVSGAFIGARAMVDLVHEAIQLLGYSSIGRGKDYLDIGNCYDLTRCVLSLILFFDCTNKPVRIMVILIYWLRLLEVNFSEYIASEVLPITRLARGLMPASTVTMLGFLGLSHAMYSLKPESFPALIRNSFTMLIAGDLPELGSGDWLAQVMCYGSILVFTVFFLNIFIGVIGTNYQQQKDRVTFLFQGVRTGICLTFLLRAKIIPCFLCSATCAIAWFSMAMGIMLVAQITWMADGQQIWDEHVTWGEYRGLLPVVFFVCQVIMMLAAYQDPEATWGWPRPGKPKRDHFLWVAYAAEEPT